MMLSVMMDSNTLHKFTVKLRGR